MYKALAVAVMGLVIFAYTGSEAVTAVKSGSYIEYTIKGDIQATQRDDETILCSNPTKIFQSHSAGKWIITITADNPGVGAHTVKLMVTPPDDLERLKSARAGDHRFYGEGTLDLEYAGQDNFGLLAVKGAFSAKGLKSKDGLTIDMEGKLFCGTM